MAKLTLKRQKQNRPDKVVVLCDKCGKPMRSDEGLQARVKGGGKRAYVCKDSNCPDFRKRMHIETMVVKVPKYIFVPDYGDIITEISKKVYVEAESVFAQSKAQYEAHLGRAKIAGNGLSYRVKRYSHNYDISKRDVAEDSDDRDIEQRKIVDDIIDIAISRVLSEDKKSDLLRALIYAAYGQIDQRQREEASKLSQLAKKYNKKQSIKSLDYSECTDFDEDPQIVEYKHLEMPTKR